MGDDTSLLIEDLEEFGNYTIEVRAHTAAGAGPYIHLWMYKHYQSVREFSRIVDY